MTVNEDGKIGCITILSCPDLKVGATKEHLNFSYNRKISSSAIGKMRCTFAPLRFMVTQKFDAESGHNP
jgi:hypothetical protein